MTQEPSPLSTLEPAVLWRCFDGIRRVPRPPRREGQIIEHIQRWSSDHGFTVRQDTFGNLVVVVPASPGCAATPPVVLQAHLDMVCEKLPGHTHDFDHDPIDVEVDGDWVRARGTTLGADNGIGVAAAMAVAIDPSVTHGPLELLFTLDEETGLNGVAALDASIVEGTCLLNLDSEEDGAIYIGCAGAGRVDLSLDLGRRDTARPGWQRLCLRVGGLLGGHSGVEIHENRGNAVKVAAQVLALALERGIDFDLVGIQGGDKDNAIPRDCEVWLDVDPGQRQDLDRAVEEGTQEARAELAGADPGLEVTLSEVDRGASDVGARPPLVTADRDRLLHLANAQPHGVHAMSLEVPGLVETSLNAAFVHTDADVARLCFYIRSSSTAAIHRLGRSLESLGRLVGADVVRGTTYTGWRPDPDSPLVRRALDVHRQLFDEGADLRAIHAGIECGILAGKIPGLDAISIGPEIRGAHSPSERVKISSTARFYRYLAALLEDLSVSDDTES